MHFHGLRSKMHFLEIARFYRGCALKYAFLTAPEVTNLSELHHGLWWSDSWDMLCSPSSDEILVPIILYMDGISVDAHGRLTLTPLNMTLGIFNTATRQKPEAWETIYFHPDPNYHSSHQSRQAEPHENIQNLHNGLRVALKSFKDVCNSGNGIKCNDLPYAGKKWNVTLKFAIAYVIGDTKLHNELCGRYLSYSKLVKKYADIAKFLLLTVLIQKNRHLIFGAFKISVLILIQTNISKKYPIIESITYLMTSNSDQTTSTKSTLHLQENVCICINWVVLREQWNRLIFL